MGRIPRLIDECQTTYTDLNCKQKRRTKTTHPRNAAKCSFFATLSLLRGVIVAYESCASELTRMCRKIKRTTFRRLLVFSVSIRLKFDVPSFDTLQPAVDRRRGI